MKRKQRRKAFRYTPTFFYCDLLLSNGIVHSMDVIDFSTKGLGLRLTYANTAIAKGETGKLSFHSEHAPFCVNQIPVTVQYIDNRQRKLGVKIDRAKCTKQQLKVIDDIEFHCIENVMVSNESDLDIGLYSSNKDNTFIFRDSL